MSTEVIWIVVFFINLDKALTNDSWGADFVFVVFGSHVGENIYCSSDSKLGHTVNFAAVQFQLVS